MHHRHRVFNGNGLAAGGLNIQLGTAKTRENKGLFAHQQMGTVELGADVDAQIQGAHGREPAFMVGHCHRKITAEADERLRAAVDHRLGGLHRVMAVVRRWLKAENLLQTVQEGRRGFLANPDGTVPLHV